MRICMAKDANYIKMINSKRWKLLRLRKMQTNPLCEICMINDKITPTKEIHHITPVESVRLIVQMEALMFDYNNLMSLCSRCHNEIHAEMFSHTKENVRKANDRRTQRFIDKFL